MNQTRLWTIIGCVLGATTVIMLTVLTTTAAINPHPVGRGDQIAMVVTLLTGTSSVALLVGARTIAAVERRAAAYAEGVAATVDRLADALPPNSPVRRIS